MRSFTKLLIAVAVVASGVRAEDEPEEPPVDAPNKPSQNVGKDESTRYLPPPPTSHCLTRPPPNPRSV